MGNIKKIYIKYKILVNGLNACCEQEIDNYILKFGNISKEYFESEHNVSETGMNFDLNTYVGGFINDAVKLSYCYLESKEYTQYEISDEVNANNITNVVEECPDIREVPKNLEKQLRLMFNIPLYFPIIQFFLYDEEKNLKSSMTNMKSLSSNNKAYYNLEPSIIENNSRFHMDYKAYKSLDNDDYKRALELYNDSFDSDKIAIRFILIFSSLESIFNLDGKWIKKNLAKYSAKLLSEDNQILYNKIHKDITELYEKRSEYIHGGDLKNITIDDEKLLRVYVRKIIISYWMVANITKKNSKEILDYLNGESLLDIQIRLMITALNADGFNSQQKNLIDVIENVYGIEIPQETKNNLLSKVE